MTHEEFIAGSRWRFAATMPDLPHEYTVRDLDRPQRTTCASPQAFEAFVRHIREHGERRAWRGSGRMFTYLVVGAYEYWTMGLPPEETTIINRQRVDARVREL